MSKCWRVILVLGLVGLMVLTACGPKGPKASETEVQGPTATPKVSQEKPASVEKAPTATRQPESVEELAYDEASDLSALKSYRFKNVISWEEEGGESDTVEMEVAYVREPYAQHLVLRGAGVGEGQSQGSFEIIRIGSDSYARLGEEWIAMQVPDEEVVPPAGVIYRPENVFREAKGRYAGQETVNGEPAKHYVFDKETLARSGLFESVLEASGEAWVSTRHNVVVRSIAHIKGKDVAKGRIVTLDVQFDLQDINADIVIEPPEGVEKPGIPEDVPIMAGATDIVSIMGMVSYKTAASLDEVTEFYKEEMEKNGWKGTPAALPGLITFEKDGRTAQVMFKEEGNRVSVAIVLQKEE